MPDTNEVAQFKAKIGFDALPRGDVPGAGFVALWPDPMTYSYFGQGGWQIVTDTVSVTGPGLVKRDWALRRGQDTVNLVVAVSSIGNAAARERLLDIASNTMFPGIPYEPTPERIGDLSIATKDHPLSQTLVWTYRNVCIRLHRTFGHDIQPLAREIQSLLEAQPPTDLSRQRPPLQNIEVSSQDVAVGGEIKATVKGVEPLDGGRYFVDFKDWNYRLMVTSEEGATSTLEAIKPGKTTLYGTVVDRRTLLSSQRTVEITVTAP